MNAIPAVAVTGGLDTARDSDYHSPRAFETLPEGAPDYLQVHKEKLEERKTMSQANNPQTSLVLADAGHGHDTHPMVNIAP
jgi:hypothetical protein